MPLTVDQVDRACTWLAEADPDPTHARRWWDAQNVALMPTGNKWDAIKIPLTWYEQAGTINGPVISDGRLNRSVVYVLVPPGTADEWDLPGTVALGVACWLPTPHPKLTSGGGPHWLQPPDGTGHLAEPGELRRALEAAH